MNNDKQADPVFIYPYANNQELLEAMDGSLEKNKVGISIKEASERIGCSEGTLYRLARKKELIGCRRFGHRFVIHWPALEAWLQSGGEL